MIISGYFKHIINIQKKYVTNIQNRNLINAAQFTEQPITDVAHNIYDLNLNHHTMVRIPEELDVIKIKNNCFSEF